MKILSMIFILIIGVLGLAFSFRINFMRSIKIKRKVMVLSGKMNITVQSFTIIVRIISFTAVSLIVLGISEVLLEYGKLSQAWFSGNIFENAFAIIGVILAQWTVIFLFWGGVSSIFFKVDVYSVFKRMNYLKKDKKRKVYTEIIRPLGVALVEGYVFYYIFIETAIKGLGLNDFLAGILCAGIYTLYKTLIYKDKNEKVLMGTWYVCVYLFGLLLFGIVPNIISIIVYLILSNILWVYKG